jgi:hypothetical protein
MESICMILYGYTYDVSIIDLITIAAFLNVKDRVIKEDRKKKIFYRHRNMYTLTKSGDGKKSSINEFRYYVADDLIDMLFLWDDFTNVIKKHSANIDKLNTWAVENALSLNGLFKVAELRDEIINIMINVIGLDPFANRDISTKLRDVLTNNMCDGLDEIKKIKRCVYESHRLMLAIWDNKLNQYVMNHTHVPINISNDILLPLPMIDDIKQVRPKFVVVTQLNLVKNMKTTLYEYAGTMISVLDNFIDVDIGFVVS